MTKITKILNHINNTPKCTHKKLVSFICDMNNRKYTSGYYHNNIESLVYKNIIRKDKYGYYHLTKNGKQNINAPYAQTKKEKQRADALNLRYELSKQLRQEKQRRTEQLLMKIKERDYIKTIAELKAFLTQFNDNDLIELSVDEEGNDFGKIANSVFQDNVDNRTKKYTLFPLLNRYL